MSKELPYTSSIKDMPLMFPDMKRTALLLCEGKSGDEIVRLSTLENIFQLEKVKRRRDVPLRMIKRLSNLGMPLIEVIANGHYNDAKLIAFLALIKADRLLFEYMYEVYADKFHTGAEEISDRDFTEFIERKAQSCDTVAKWSANNLSDIRGKIKSALCDAGLAKRIGGNLLIQKPIIDDGLRKLIEETDRVYAKAMLMEP